MNHAIVVGIDNYTDKSWQLDAAVSDALAFADWASTDGGVPKEKLRLLLAPKPDHPATANGKAKLAAANIEVDYYPATSDEIDKVRIEYRNNFGQGAEKLYFY